LRLAGDPPDIHITPRIGPLGWLDFHRVAEAIIVGRTAVEKALDSITETVAELRRPFARRRSARRPVSGGRPKSLASVKE
jgi:NTE family protein